MSADAACQRGPAQGALADKFSRLSRFGYAASIEGGRGRYSYGLVSKGHQMVSEPVDEESEDADLDEDANAPSLTSYKRRPQHERCLAEVFQMDSEQLLARLSVERYDQPGFIPAEVLVTLARSRFSSSRRVRSEIAVALNRCLLTELRYFVNKNLQWYSVTRRSGEWERDAVAEIRKAIFSSRVEVSFAEATFRVFADRRLRDWFKSQARWKNMMPSVDGFIDKDDGDGDGNRLSLTGQVEDDTGSSPEEQLAQKQLFARCRLAVARLPEHQRIAVVLYVLQDMTYKQAGEVMKLDESSVRYHVTSALKALRNGDWHE